MSKLKNEEQEIEREIKTADEEKERIKQDEEKYWSEYCKYQYELAQTEEQQKRYFFYVLQNSTLFYPLFI